MLNNLDTIHHYRAGTGEAVEKSKPYKRPSGKLQCCFFAVFFAFPSIRTGGDVLRNSIFVGRGKK